MKKTLLLLLSVIPVFVHAQITIAAARALPIGSTVTIRGIVLNGSELGTIRYIEDPTGGMGIYSSSVSSWQRGDSVEVTGVTSNYFSLIEMNPVNASSLISSGNPLPAPQVVTMAVGFSEAYEGELVRFNTSHFISTGNFSSASTAYTATDGTVGSAQVWETSTTNISGTPIPVGDIDMVGIMSQHTDYQLIPRDLNDFITQGNPPVFTSSLKQSNITTSGFTVSFTTQNAGNTIIEYGSTLSLGVQVSDATMTLNHSMDLTGLYPASLYYVRGITVSTSGDTSKSAITPMMTQSMSSGNIKCYFTRNVDNTVAQGTNAITLSQTMDDTLIAYMNRAIYTMDIAIYNMDNDNGIVDAINAAYNRGVVVRVIGDGANMGSTAWGLLNIGSNMQKLSPTTSGYGIMHNKFVIIDANSIHPNDAIAWTGSMNFTDQQVNSDANNVIIFQDQSLARAYEIEFNEMWSGLFGPDKTDNTPKEFNIGGTSVQLYMSPSDDTETHIKDAAESADWDLEFAVYSYTRYTISYAIDDRTSAGVYGGGVIDDTANGSYAYSVLAQHMPGTLFVVNYSYLMHNKYLIVDANAPYKDPVVLTGSHNWTTSAQTSNDENTVVVHNASIANQYYQEWVQRFHDAGGTLLPTYNVGIENPATSLTVSSLYPNPADNMVNLALDYANESAGTISILDMNGRTLQQVNTDLHSGRNTFQFNIGDLSAGVYFISVTTGDYSVTRKLVVE